MAMSLGAIGAIGMPSVPVNPNSPAISGRVASGAPTDFSPAVNPGVEGGQKVGGGFGDLLQSAVQKVSDAQGNADNLAVKAATGDLKNIHDYTIAATQAQLVTQVTVAVRNKAVEAFQEIMRMPL